MRNFEIPDDLRIFLEKNSIIVLNCVACLCSQIRRSTRGRWMEKIFVEISELNRHEF